MKKLLVLLLLVFSVTAWTSAEAKQKVSDTTKKELKADTTAVDTAKAVAPLADSLSVPEKPKTTFLDSLREFYNGLIEFKISSLSLLGIIILFGLIIYAAIPSKKKK